MFSFHKTAVELGSMNDFMPGLFYDLPNLIVCLFLAAYVCKRRGLNSIYFIVLSLHALLPFFLNGILFNPRYMPDQYKYFEAVLFIRDFDFHLLGNVNTINAASYILSFIPIPIVLTVKSLGFANVFIYICVFDRLFDFRKCESFNLVAWVYLMYPSLALYSALSLRDMLVCSIMIISMLELIRGRLLVSFIIMLPLVILKFQNAFICFIVYTIYILSGLYHGRLNFKKLILLLISGIVLSIALFPYVIDKVNFYRVAMYYEDGGVGDVAQITSLFDMISFGLIGSFSFFFRPLFFEATSLLEVIQSLENILIVFLVFYCMRNSKNSNRYFWFICLIISSCIYGVVVYNLGTMARYKFPFIIIFVLGCYLDRRFDVGPNNLCKRN